MLLAYYRIAYPAINADLHLCHHIKLTMFGWWRWTKWTTKSSPAFQGLRYNHRVFYSVVTTTWIDNMTAHFPMELWTQYDNIDEIRTNNHLEGWHCSINRLLRRPHPNVFALIEILKAEQRSTETEVRLLQAGRASPVQCAAHRHITERLVHLKQMLLNSDINVHQYAGSVGGVLKLRD